MAEVTMWMEEDGMRTSISVEAESKDQALSTVLGYVAPSMSTNGAVTIVDLVTLPLELEQSMSTEELDDYMLRTFRRQYAVNTGNDPALVQSVTYRKRKLLLNNIVQYNVYGAVIEPDPEPVEPTPEEPPVEEPPIPTE
ncbi:hypothetical protein [Micromonospora sp. WMMD1274]|uniref:hypothetical protein n=1 Tax=Micromonospora sp. WMMD1274 TaxID=3404116 RepID=UPI003B93F2BD